MKTWWVASIVVLAAWWATSIVALTLLVAPGSASNGPAPEQTSHAGDAPYDRHFQYYTEIRPLLGYEHDALTAMCGDGESRRTVAQKKP